MYDKRRENIHLLKCNFEGLNVAKETDTILRASMIEF